MSIYSKIVKTRWDLGNVNVLKIRFLGLDPPVYYGSIKTLGTRKFKEEFIEYEYPK